jgi:putative photosynthetic complex assembly protein
VSIQFEAEPGSRPDARPITVPRPALYMAGILIVFTFGLAIAARYFNTGGFRETATTVQSQRALFFTDQPGGGIAITDGTTGQQVTQLPAGTNGFLRGALRALTRSRRAAGIGATQPFQLIRYTDGRLVLLDPATTKHVTISSFGPTQIESFDRLLR